MSDILKISFGFVVAILTAYATSSIVLARKQQAAATRLIGYLHFWQKWIIENGLQSLYEEGVKWNRESREIPKARGRGQQLFELQERKKKKFITEAIEYVEKNGFEGFDIKKITDRLKKIPKEYSGTLLTISERARQNIIEGKTFISDDEISSLGSAFTQYCIELKTVVIDMLDSCMLLGVIMMSAPDAFNVSEYAEDVSQLIWKGITASKHIDMLSQAAKVISERSIARLTWENMRYGGRTLS